MRPTEHELNQIRGIENVNGFQGNGAAVLDEVKALSNTVYARTKQVPKSNTLPIGEKNCSVAWSVGEN